MPLTARNIGATMRRLAPCLLALVALAVAGCGDREPPKYIMRFYIETRIVGSGKELTMPTSKAKMWYSTAAVLSEGDVTGVELIQSATGYGSQEDLKEPGLYLRVLFSRTATFALRGVSTSNQGKNVILFLNDKPVGASRITGPVADGQLVFVMDDWLGLPANKRMEVAGELVLDLQESVEKIQKLKK